MRNIVTKLFKVNTTNQNTSNALELFFDFVVVAMVSLIFNGFIINSHVAPTDQMFHMVFSAGILATHWYAHAFFKQRYEKKGVFFRVWTFLKLIGLGIMATGLDLMVFRLNGDANAQEFLRWLAPTLFVIGVIFSRLVATAEFLLAAYANKESRALVNLTIYKAISRITVVLLAIAHLVIILTNKNMIAETTYVFMPLYLVVELLGNFAFVTTKTLAAAPEISMRYAKDRFTKLNILYISSLIVSGTTQFAFYFRHETDMYMISRLALTYLVAFLAWWAYSDRVYRMNLKMTPKHMIMFNAVSLAISMALAIFGGMLINANDNNHFDLIIPIVLISLALILILFNISMVMLSAEDISKKDKIQMILFTIPFIVTMIAFGLVSIWVSMPFWSMYVIVATSLLALNIHSRYIIWKSRKSIKYS